MTAQEEQELGDKKLAQFIKHGDSDIATDNEILEFWNHGQEWATESLNALSSQATGIDFTEHALLMSTILRDQCILKPIAEYVHD